MSQDNSEFFLVTFRKEIDKLLSDLQSKATSMAGMTEDHHQFQFYIKHVADDVVYVTPLAPVGRALKTGENIQIIFGLPDGLFLVKTQVLDANEIGASFRVSQEVYRLQRRNNFRTHVPLGYKLSFRLTSHKTSMNIQGSPPLIPIDISAGGLRVRWPAQNLPKPEVDDRLSGILSLPTGKQVELFGLVRTVFPDQGGAFQVGIEFQNMSVRDEQLILFVCVQIHREQQPAIR